MKENGNTVTDEGIEQQQKNKYFQHDPTNNRNKGNIKKRETKIYKHMQQTGKKDKGRKKEKYRTEATMGREP